MYPFFRFLELPKYYTEPATYDNSFAIFFLHLDDFGRCDKLMKADNEVHLLKRFFVQQRLRPQRSNTIMQTAVSEPVDCITVIAFI